MASAEWEKLIALVGRLPPDKAEKLRELLNSENFGNVQATGFADMMKALELRRGDANGPDAETLMRRVCKYLEPFLFDKVDDADSAGSVTRATLAIWWSAARIDSKQLREWEEAFAEAISRRGVGDAARVAAAATGELAKQAQTLRIDGASAKTLADVRRIGAILAGGAPLNDALIALDMAGPVRGPGKVEMSDQLTETFALECRKASESQLFDPVWLGHAALHHLRIPWEVLRLVRAFQQGAATASRLEGTEFSPVIQRVMELLRRLAEHAAASVRDASRSRKLEDIQRAALATADYFDASELIANQIALERESSWGKLHIALRKSVSEMVTEKLDSYETILVDFVEDWDEAEQVRAHNLNADRAFATAAMLGAWRIRSNRHGFSMALSELARRSRALLSRSLGRTPDGKQAWAAQKSRLLLSLGLA